MIAAPFELLRRLMFLLPPEAAHRTALELLHLGRAVRWPLPGGPIESSRPVERMGLRFANPVGLAAGFDKSGDFVDDLGALGFGFVEIGTLTPHPQPGNPRPRLFRLPEHTALINQMGSPNKGIDHAIDRLRRRAYGGVLGANIGKRFDTRLDRAVDDYLGAYESLRRLVDYVVLNVSSPNTPQLRELQDRAHLGDILRTLVGERDGGGKRTPVLVKLSPDFPAERLVVIADMIAESGIDGVVATNSTVSRDGIKLSDSRLARGGLSGSPLHEKSVGVIRTLRARLRPAQTIIGVGGIVSAAAASETLEAGADLIQLYTGLVYEGPRLIADIILGLSQSATTTQDSAAT